ncbi:MAG TPA: alpha-glucuronidase family glycosyl hydrolase [Croceibacterium sp.]|nr:alpha-glucuronidase family glycosyl hydrolase [Croceibacterium sp.]
MRPRLGACLAMAASLLAAASPALAEDGYALWLRYPAAARGASEVIVARSTPMADAAAAELRRGLAGRIARVLLATTADPRVVALRLARPIGAEGYLVRTAQVGGEPTVVIAADDDRGLLYGAFALLRHLNTGGSQTAIDLRSAPRIKLRLLNHWDNLDGLVERGYAGQSLWDWWTLPDHRDPLYTDYARASASLGINGAVLNNVNAKSDSLTAAYIAKAAALADIFRPYGIKVYLSARFTAPHDLGGLPTGDPLDPAVRAWWAAKADEIYRAIPDFGGFLVKANSEGQPGPGDYGRTHADGANMLAAALAPHGGVVMWRAFVYSETNPEDRAKQAYSEFRPLDGTFADNVLVQVKNGAIDFQPREPFHPLFGAMRQTPLMLELQITKEYLGQGTSLAYLGPLFTEVLNARTYRGDGRGPTVAQVIDGSAEGHALTGIAGVANVGRSRDWSGSTFNQANWYAFGRLAWDPGLSAEAIAREWAAQTFSPDPRVVDPVVRIMMASREAVVNYTGPLGLAHQMATGHHYGPGPWIADLARPEWNPAYYNRADAGGIGFDRTRSGSDAISQYAPELAALLADPRTTPERDLLWFHHLAWDHRLASGRTLWEELVAHYDAGVAAVVDMRRAWEALRPLIDEERWQKTADLLAIQQREARWWRDASIAYWMSVNGLPLPAGAAPPAHDLAWYKAQSFPYAPGNP